MLSLAAALAIDALGSGLLAPFELIYGHQVVGVSLVEAGVALSVGSLVSVPLGPIAGALSDRAGARSIAAVANALGALGCLVLLSAHELIALSLAALLLGSSQRVLWAVFTPIVIGVTERTSADVWFGRLRATRLGSIAAGQALAGAFLVLGLEAGLRAIVVADAASFVVAGVLLGRGQAAGTRAVAAGAGGYAVALRDGANRTLALLNVLATLLIVAPTLALPVLALEQLALPTWLPGLLGALSTGVVGIGTMFSPRLLRGHRRVRNLQLASAIWAVGLLGVAFSSTAPRAAIVAALVLSVVIWSIGESVYAPTADALPAVLAPPHLVGRYAALHQMAWGIAEVIAPTLVAALLTTGTQTTWLVLAVIALTTTALYRATEIILRGRDGLVGV